MSERHESDCALDDEHADRKDTIEALEQEGAQVFSPRDYQEGFWGN